MLALIQKYQIIAAVAVAALLWAAWEGRLIIGMLLGGYIIAAALLPAVEYLTTRMLPRVLAVVAVYGLLGGAFVLATALITAPVRESLRSLSSDVSAKSIGTLPFGIEFESVLRTLNAGIAGAAGSTLTLVSTMAVSFVLSVYIVYDWKRIREGFLSYGTRGTLMIQILDRHIVKISGWARGQLVLSGIVGILVFIGLTIIGVPHAIILAIAAAIFELIPYAGPILAAVPAILFALPNGGTTAIIVAALYVAIQQFENHALVPLIMKRAIRMHPIVTIIVILIGFSVFGIFGALIAVPTASLISTAYASVQSHKKRLS